MSARFRVLVVAIAALASPAVAAPLSIISEVRVEQRVAAPNGTTRIVLAVPTRVGPGDPIVFTLRYRNAGKQPLGDLMLTSPVPAGIVYRAVLPGMPAPEVSVDGRRFGTLGELRVLRAGVERAARAADVVAVRWRIAEPLAPGASGMLAFAGAVK